MEDPNCNCPIWDELQVLRKIREMLVRHAEAIVALCVDKPAPAVQEVEPGPQMIRER